MSDKEKVYKIAYSFLKQINSLILKEIESRGITPEEFFTLPTKELVSKLGIRHEHKFDRLAREEAVNLAHRENERIKQHNIKALFLLDDNYPLRLSEIPEPPIIIYKLGEANLESEHVLAVVGTRKPTPYGFDFCNKIVEETGEYFNDVVIVSGLAYGIDATAHKKAIEMNLPTVAVVAHGLNMIYPAAHRNLAKEIIRKGGALLSEYPFDTKPFKPNFLARNRIVAGLSDATIIVESNLRGGAMSTANYAFMYNREVLALPGRRTDELSSGCNTLIRKNKAHLIECCADLIEATGWQPLNLPVNTKQRNLFPELQGDSKKIYDQLRLNTEPLQIDIIVNLTGLSVSTTMSLLNEMEFEGIVIRYPGNRYSVA